MKKPTRKKVLRKQKLRTANVVGPLLDLNRPEPTDETEIEWPRFDEQGEIIPPTETSASKVKKNKKKTKANGKPRYKIKFKKDRAFAAVKEDSEETDIDYGDTLWNCVKLGDEAGWLARLQGRFKERSAKGFARFKLDDALRNRANALLHGSGSMDGPAIIDDSLMMSAHERLHRQLADYLARDPANELLFVTLIPGDADTSLSRPVIDIKKLKQQASSILRRIGPNHFGMLELSCFSSITHKDGGRYIQPHTHALVYGPRISATYHNALRKMRRKFEPNLTSIDPCKVRHVTDTSPENLARLSAYLMKPPAKCKNWYKREDGRDVNNHSDANMRFIRYTRMAQIRSMLSIDDVALAGGDGVAIRSSLVKDLRGLSKAAGRGKSPMHPEALPSFWADFNHAIKRDDFAVPVILRK